jgi:hypothetical protein
MNVLLVGVQMSHVGGLEFTNVSDVVIMVNVVSMCCCLMLMKLCRWFSDARRRLVLGRPCVTLVG